MQPFEKVKIDKALDPELDAFYWQLTTRYPAATVTARHYKTGEGAPIIADGSSDDVFLFINDHNGGGDKRVLPVQRFAEEMLAMHLRTGESFDECLQQMHVTLMAGTELSWSEKDALDLLERTWKDLNTQLTLLW